MTRPSLHPTPRPRDVFSEQLRVVGLVLRAPTIAAMLLLGAITLAGMVSGGRPEGFHPELSMLPALVGAVLPFALWRDEDRRGDGLLWTLPVDRGAHALARVAAGWTWLMAIVATFVLWELALFVAAGGRPRAPETVLVLPTTIVPAPGTLDPAGVRSVMWHPTPLLWLAPFTAATGVYLLASALALGTRRPLRWVVAPLIAVAAVFAAGDVTKSAWLTGALQRALDTSFGGAYGLDALLTARSESLHTQAILTTGHAIGVWRALPDAGQWATATALWTTVGLLALWTAARRHRERRRG